MSAKMGNWVHNGENKNDRQLLLWAQTDRKMADKTKMKI